MTDNDEYPSWREALFNGDKIANLRCAAKYLFWHGAYFLLALVGIVLYGGAKAIDLIRRRGGGRAANTASSAITDGRVKKASRWIWGGFVVVYLTFGISYILYVFAQILIANPLATIGATIIAVVVVAVVCVLIAIGVPYIMRALSRGGSAVKRGASRAGSRAVETPGVRRVYGVCPVSMDIEPKWFNRIFDED